MFNGIDTSFIGTTMNMKADVYIQQNVQDPNTGAIKREWLYAKTIQCKIEPIKSRGASSKGDNKSFARTSDMDYDEKIQLKMYSLELMSKRWRIDNIRTSDNRQVFVEIDKIDQPDTKFEVTASHAVLDPFGKITFYDTILLRSEMQDDTKA